MPMKAVSVGLTQVRLTKRDNKRTVITIVNNDGVAVVYINEGKGASVTNSTPLFSYQSMTIAKPSGDNPKLDYWAISDTASTDVRVYEGYENIEIR